MKTVQFDDGTHVTFHSDSVTISNACGSATVSRATVKKAVELMLQPTEKNVTLDGVEYTAKGDRCD